MENENCASSNQTNNSYEYFLQKTKEAHRMSKFRLFIATSIDGYIAREDGSIDWLDSIDHPEGVDYGYAAVYVGSIDIVNHGYERPTKTSSALTSTGLMADYT